MEAIVCRPHISQFQSNFGSLYLTFLAHYNQLQLLDSVLLIQCFSFHLSVKRLDVTNFFFENGEALGCPFFVLSLQLLVSFRPELDLFYFPLIFDIHYVALEPSDSSFQLAYLSPKSPSQFCLFDFRKCDILQLKCLVVVIVIITIRKSSLLFISIEELFFGTKNATNGLCVAL